MLALVKQHKEETQSYQNIVIKLTSKNEEFKSYIEIKKTDQLTLTLKSK